MALSGEFATMMAVDLLQWIAQRAKTGMLALELRSTRKRVGFLGGRLHSAASNDPREMLGQYLVREGLVTEEALFTALLRQETDQRRLGALLLEDGALTDAALHAALQACAQEALCDIFLWTDGRFEFDPAVTPATPGLEVDMNAVIAEGARRARAWQQIRRRIPSSEVTFRAVQPQPPLAHLHDRILYRLAEEGRSLAEISLHMRQSEFATAERLSRLCDQGLLAANDDMEAAGAIDLVAAIQGLLAMAAERLRDGRFAAAQEAYENALSLDSLNAEAKKGLRALEEAREHARVAAEVPLDRVPIMRLGSVALTQQHFDPQEAFVLSRINGQWDVRSILKLCPMREEEALLIFARLLDRRTIELQ